MKTTKQVTTAIALAAALFGVAHAARPATAPHDAEAAYTSMIDQRVAAIVVALKLNDPAKADRVTRTLTRRYRELRDWHAAHDAELKSLGWKPEADGPPEKTRSQIQSLQADLKATRDAFLAKLAQDLSPEQVTTVKDKMTYDKVHVTYEAYQEIVPNLTPQQKARLRDLLGEAREEAIDGGSSEEKSAVFKRFKNFCKAYLIEQGHDVNQDYRNWGEAQQMKQAAKQATTRAGE